MYTETRYCPRCKCDLPVYRFYTIDNVVPCCRECNQAKSDCFTYDEMKQIGAVINVIKLKRSSAP